MKFTDRLRYAWRFASLAISGRSSDPADDAWYDGTYTTFQSLFGGGGNYAMRQALRNDAVYACVSYLANVFSALPAKVYRRFPDGTKEEASRHPLYEVLHYQPNELNSASDFRHREQVYFELAGNAYSEIVPDSRGPVGQLLPLDSARMSPVRKSDGRVIFEYRREDGSTKFYLPEEIHRLSNLSLDGISGLSTISVWSDIIGGAVALENYGNRLVRNDSRPGGVLKFVNSLKHEQKEEHRKQWEAGQGGRNLGRVAILDGGGEFLPITINNKDSQYLEIILATVPKIARMFGLPPTKIGWLEKSSYANVEELNIATVTDAVLPRSVRREQAIRRDLLTREDRAAGYFVEFDLAVLLRGSIAAQYAAFNTGVSAGFLTRNEPRRWLNLNALPGLDNPLVPLNMGVVGPDGRIEQSTGDQRQQDRRQQDQPPQDPAPSDSRAAMLALTAAHSLAMGECAALSRAMNREGSNGKPLSGWLEEFYAALPERIANRLGVDMESARSYTEAHRIAALDAVHKRGLGALVKDWEKSAGPQLAGLVVESL